MPISRYLGKSESAYWARRGRSTWSVWHRLGSYSLSFTGGGAELSTAAGNSVQFKAPGGASVSAEHNTVSYRSGARSEWFSYGPAGLEQGWTLQSPPQAAARGGEITLPVTTTGTLRPVLRKGQIDFEDAAGKPALAYGGLSATDARGHDLKASLSLSGGRLQIQVAARGASYPIVVDPTITVIYSNATLQDRPAAQVASDMLGVTVAVDGSTIVVGEPDNAPCTGGNAGRVDIFTEPAGGWSGNLTPAAVLGNPQDGDSSNCSGGTSQEFGSSVAIATVGGVQTIVAAAPHDNADSSGAVYTYDEPTGGWGSLAEPYFGFSQKLDSYDSNSDQQGTSVAIDDDTIVVGTANATAVNGASNTGTVDVYTKSDGSWSQVATLSSDDEHNSDAGLGTSVALAHTSYGTVVVGGMPDLFDPTVNDNTGANVGGALLWIEPAGGWEAEVVGGNGGVVSHTILPEVLLSDMQTSDAAEAGDAVAIDPTGSLVAVGAPDASVGNEFTGAALVYAAPSTSGGWNDAASEVQPDAALQPAHQEASNYFGSGLAIDKSIVYATELNYDDGTSAHGYGNGAVLEFSAPSLGWAGYDGTVNDSTDLVASGAYSTGTGSPLTAHGNSAALAIDHGSGAVVAGAVDMTAADDFGGALIWGSGPAVPTTTTTTTTTTPITPAKQPASKPTGGATVSGTAAAGETLTCHAVNWTGGATLSYGWKLNGQPIPGAGGDTLTLTKADASGTIICVVTGSNAAGTTTVDSKPVNVGVCVVPRGSMHGKVLGPVHLGMAAADVFSLFPKQNQTHYGTQRFCVVGGDERVEFPTQKLLHSLTSGLRHELQQRVVMELTANPRYMVDGIYHGISVAKASKHAKLGSGFKIGANTWYLIAGHGDDVLLKSQHGIVQEIGFIDTRLISSGGLVRFFSTFLNSGITL